MMESDHLVVAPCLVHMDLKDLACTWPTPLESHGWGEIHITSHTSHHITLPLHHHYITLQYIHSIPLHCQCTTITSTGHHYTALHHLTSPLHCITSHHHYTASPLHHITPLTPHCITSHHHYTTLHRTASPHITITLHHLTSPLHCITSHHHYTVSPLHHCNTASLVSLARH